jgi:hypothetical protein
MPSEAFDEERLRHPRNTLAVGPGRNSGVDLIPLRVDPRRTGDPVILKV